MKSLLKLSSPRKRGTVENDDDPGHFALEIGRETRVAPYPAEAAPTQKRQTTKAEVNPRIITLIRFDYNRMGFDFPPSRRLISNCWRPSDAETGAR